MWQSNKVTTMSKFVEAFKVIFLCLAVFVIAGASFYACEIMPLEECQKEGHSFQYCYKLLNK